LSAGYAKYYTSHSAGFDCESRNVKRTRTSVLSSVFVGGQTRQMDLIVRAGAIGMTILVFAQPPNVKNVQFVFKEGAIFV
jgi:hypothetical protein